MEALLAIHFCDRAQRREISSVIMTNQDITTDPNMTLAVTVRWAR